MKAKVYESNIKVCPTDDKLTKIRVFLWTNNNFGGTRNLVKSTNFKS